MIELYNDTCFKCSKLITNNYSTSFSLGIKAFQKKFRDPIYSIYGFVRYADEIVDTFHAYDKQKLIADFKKATFEAINDGISLNPVLHSFQLTVKKFGITPDLIEAFLLSMEMDLYTKVYDAETYKAYIYGSAEAVGLMCLRVFCENNESLYQILTPKACSLGSAFQKINFLRDIKQDHEERGRVYFPHVNLTSFSLQQKQAIEHEIKIEMDDALKGIKMLPEGAKLGVYIAYLYYQALLDKIVATPIDVLLKQRIRITNPYKLMLYIKASIQHTFNRI